MNLRKKIIIVVMTLSGLMISITSNSQVLISILLGDKLNSGAIEFGLSGGYTNSQIFSSKDTKGLNSGHLGFYFDIRLKNKLFLYTGVQVKSNLGATGLSMKTYAIDDQDLDTLLKDATLKRKLNYFNVPIMIKYRFKSNIYVNAGVQLGLRYKSYDYYYEKIEEKNDLIYKYSIKDQLTRIDAGVTAGLGYKFKYGWEMNIGARYYYGLTNIYKSNGYGTNGALYIFGEIPIGAGKQKEKMRKEIEEEMKEK
ncbi:porin family protein [Bacteroidota bacterium]